MNPLAKSDSITAASPAWLLGHGVILLAGKSILRELFFFLLATPFEVGAVLGQGHTRHESDAPGH